MCEIWACRRFSVGASAQRAALSNLPLQSMKQILGVRKIVPTKLVWRLCSIQAAIGHMVAAYCQVLEDPVQRKHQIREVQGRAKMHPPYESGALSQSSEQQARWPLRLLASRPRTTSPRDQHGLIIGVSPRRSLIGLERSTINSSGRHNAIIGVSPMQASTQSKGLPRKAPSEGGWWLVAPRRVRALALREILDLTRRDERSDGCSVGHCVVGRKELECL